jgi:DNA (cytosine-5)-methyltransferase 1
LLDLFSGVGGGARGYQRAGFYVIGVDKIPQPRYAGDAFIQFDAIEFLVRLLAGEEVAGWRLEDFAAIHASPPCQRWALASRYNGREYPDFITPARWLLQHVTVPWVIENCPTAPLRPDIKLCGCMFALEIEIPGVGVCQLRRERWFETSWNDRGLIPPHDHHGPAISIAGHGTPSWMRKRTGHVRVEFWRQVTGIDWTTRDELTEAIPPAYGEYLGERLREHMRAVAA